MSKPSGIFPPEPRISVWEIEHYVRDRFVGEFGDEIVRKVSADKYPYEYGVMVTVAKEDLGKMFRLIDDIEAEFTDKGFHVDIALTTHG